MLNVNLTYCLYGAIVFTDLAWVEGGLIMAALYAFDARMVDPHHHGNRIFLVLIPLPWVALIGFSWLSQAMRSKGQSDAAWGASFLSLTLWVLYVVVTGKLLLFS